MGAAFMSTQEGTVTYLEDMTLSENSQFGDRGAC